MRDQEISNGLMNADVPWSRQSRVDPATGKTTVESGQAWSAFCMYRDLGTDRSLATVSGQCGKNKSLLERWSTRWSWRERVTAYDNHLDNETLKATMGERIRMGQRQARLAMRAQDLASRLLTELSEELSRPTSETIGGKTVVLRRRPSVSESARLLDVASRLEQSVRGTPKADSVANIIIHVELQKRPRYETVPESAPNPAVSQE